MPVTLVEKYNPEWSKWFEQIKSFLGKDIVEACIGVEHVGSTSIPGMVAKPIIDLVLVIEPLEFEKIKNYCQKRDITHQGDLGIEDREAFDLKDISTKDSIPYQHLYVCPKDSFELKKEIAFRDFLKHNHGYAERLSKLKWSLAEKHGNDRTAYMRGKAELCEEITKKALEK